VLVTGQWFLPSQKLGVDLGEFLQPLLELAVALDACFSRLLLGGCLEEELIDFSDRQALRQVVKGTVFNSPMMAAAVGLATTGEALNQGGAQAVGQDLDLREQKAFAFAQSQGGLAEVMYLGHIHGEDNKNAAAVNEKEYAQEMRKCLTAGKQRRS
jgi:hypothetical protein